MTKQEIIDYVMTTPSNPNKAVLEGMLDSIADAGGGGGSSDFSTAQVKAINNPLGSKFKTIAFIGNGEMVAGYDEVDEFFLRSFTWVDVSNPLNVVMYNGHADLTLAFRNEVQIVATENPDNVVITYNDETGMYNLALTGDCTITIS